MVQHAVEAWDCRQERARRDADVIAAAAGARDVVMVTPAAAAAAAAADGLNVFPA